MLVLEVTREIRKTTATVPPRHEHFLSTAISKEKHERLIFSSINRELPRKSRR